MVFLVCEACKLSQIALLMVFMSTNFKGKITDPSYHQLNVGPVTSATGIPYLLLGYLPYPRASFLP